MYLSFHQSPHPSSLHNSLTLAIWGLVRGISSSSSSCKMAPFIRSVNRTTSNSCSWEESSDTFFPPPQDEPHVYSRIASYPLSSHVDRWQNGRIRSCMAKSVETSKACRSINRTTQFDSYVVAKHRSLCSIILGRFLSPFIPSLASTESKLVR